MKTRLFIVAITCLCACSNEYESIIEQDEEVVTKADASHKIDAGKAFEIANIYFNQEQVRSASPLKMEFILKHKTRSGISEADTIAYIINRGTEDGFAIVSSDDRVYPIIAYSKTGTFKYKKGDMVDLEFISRLGAYLEENKDNKANVVTASQLDGCIYNTPILSASWSQRSPWDKYVIKEHPGCPVGCVAVATGMIMSSCKSSHLYHGVDFLFERIIKGVRTDSGLVNPSVTPYDREVALDYAAKLLYWIGKDVKTSYSPSVSLAFSDDAYNLIANEGYIIEDPGLMTFNIHNATSQLIGDNLLYMRGTDTSGGHAWVADGYSYCADVTKQDTVMATIHCDWGWGGDCNGYYTGDVFAAGRHEYGAIQYFAVRNERFFIRLNL